jgi:hypothetical protein
MSSALRWSRVALAACLGLYFAATPGSLNAVSTAGSSAQRVEGATCQQDLCEIVLTAVTKLPEGAHRLHRPALNVVADPSGNFYVRSADERQVVVFDGAGRQVGTLAVPVEGQRIGLRLVPVIGGTVLAWVGASGAGFELLPNLTARAWKGAMPFLPVYVGSDRSMIVSQQIRTPQQVGFPIHLVGADGTVLRSFGSDVAEYRADLRLLLERVVAPGTNGLLWAIPKGRYSIERWDPTTGKLIGRVSVKSNWFVESKTFRVDTNTKPNAVIEGVWEDGGVVWTLIRDGANDWKPTVKPEQSWSVRDYNSEHDWVLEAVNGTTGEVLASRRVPHALSRVGVGPLVASYALTQAGEADGLAIWRPEVRRRGTQSWQ